MAMSRLESTYDTQLGGSKIAFQLDTATAHAYAAGMISYDTVRKVALADTGYTGVRNNVGMETYIPFYNDTGSAIDNGKVINAFGADATNKVVKGILAKADSPLTSSAIIGVATHTVPDQTVGLATVRGDVNDIDTSGFTISGPLYVSDLVAGDFTQTRPQHPSKIVVMGSVVYSHATEGVVLVEVRPFDRKPIVKDYHISTGSNTTHYIAGFYDWSATSVALTQASTSVTHGTAGRTRAAHVGIVPQAAGSVDTGQVGIRVTGTTDSDTGVQVGSQTAIIIDDITTLSANTMAETIEKFSGQVTIELYVVSGTPTTYSLTFNYGFSKYEDYGNRDFTLAGFEAVWEGNATENGMDIIVKHHSPTGWTYAASGFVAGNGVICQRSVDQSIESNVASGVQGAYKRSNLQQYVEGSGLEGVIVSLVTTTINSIASMDIHMLAYSEELA
jgi:hypothetical protein